MRPVCASRSFHWAASNAESLEHFHLFTKPETNLSHAASAGEPALHMHSDMGIFLIMTPAAYFRIDEAAIPSAPTAGMNSGFYLELPSGELVHPTFPPNSLLVMGGEASARCVLWCLWALTCSIREDDDWVLGLPK